MDEPRYSTKVVQGSVFLHLMLGTFVAVYGQTCSILAVPPEKLLSETELSGAAPGDAYLCVWLRSPF